MKLSLNAFLLIFVFSLAAFAQTPTVRERGIELYKQKKYSEAVPVLQSIAKQNKKDAEIWNMLGVAYLNINDFKQSRKALANAVKISPQDSNYRTNLAFANLISNKLKPAAKEIETAIRLNAQNAEAYYIRGNLSLRQGRFEEAIADADRAIKIKPAFSSPYLLKVDGYLYSFGNIVSTSAKPSDKIILLKKAKETLEICRVDCEKNFNLQAQQERLDAIGAFYDYFSRNNKFEAITEAMEFETSPATVEKNVTPIKILAKPRAKYTDSARRADVQGTVRLAVLFSAEGKTKYVMVIRPLSNGLTETAVAAARQIQFQPQLKDGKPVPVVKIVEYTFTLY